MEKHNHPTAKQRLGDSEAGLGSAATLTAAGRRRDPRHRAACSTSAEGLHQNVHVKAGDKRWFTRLHGTDHAAAADSPRVDVPQRPLLQRRRAVAGGAGDRARQRGRPARCSATTNPVGRDVTIWNQPFRVVGVVTTTSWMVAPAPGDDQFDAVYIPFSTVHRLLNLAKLNDITITAASTGDVVADHGRRDEAAARPPQDRRRQAGRLHGHDAGAPGAGAEAACARTSRARSSATSRDWRR